MSHIYASKKAIALLRERGELVEKDGKIYYDGMEVIEYDPKEKNRTKASVNNDTGLITND